MEDGVGSHGRRWLKFSRGSRAPVIGSRTGPRTRWRSASVGALCTGFAKHGLSGSICSPDLPSHHSMMSGSVFGGLLVGWSSVALPLQHPGFDSVTQLQRNDFNGLSVPIGVTDGVLFSYIILFGY